MKKRWIVVTLIVILSAFCLVALIPASRWRILGWLNGEPLVEGRPTTYWLIMLKDPEPRDRRRAALVLGERANFEGRPRGDALVHRTMSDLSRVILDPDETVRKSAATSFLNYKEWFDHIDPDTIVPLARGLSDQDDTVRKITADLLGQLGPKAVFAKSELLGSLKDKLAAVREDSAKALGQIGPDAKDAVPGLLRTLKDPDREVREQSAKALGLIGQPSDEALTKETIASLAQALKDEEGDVRMHSARSLGRMGRDATTAIPALKEALKDPDERVRKEALDALAKLS
jgi:hypothetical protein